MMHHKPLIRESEIQFLRSAHKLQSIIRVCCVVKLVFHIAKGLQVGSRTISLQTISPEQPIQLQFQFDIYLVKIHCSNPASGSVKNIS